MSSGVIARNIVSRLGAKSVSYVAGAAASVLLIRYLGVEQLGQYTYASTFASLFGLLAGAGLPILLTREAARDRRSAGTSLGGVLVLQYRLAGLSFVTVALAGALLNADELALAIAILGLGIAVNAVGAPYLAMLNAFEKMHVSSAIEILSAILRTGLIVAAVQLRMGLTALVALLQVSPVATFVLTKLASDRYCARAEHPRDPLLARRLVVAALPFALMVILSNVYYRIDIIMLAKIRGDAAVGIYSAGYKLIDFLILVGANIAGVLYPRMSEQARGAPDALARTIETSHRYLTALAVPVAVAVTVLADWIVGLLFGEAFSDSAWPLRILVWGVAATFMYMPMAHALNAAGREWHWVGILSLNALLNTGLNLLLIPAYSFVGAAISTVACELVSLTLVALAVQAICPVRCFAGFGPVAASSLVAGLGVWAFGYDHVVAGLLVAAASYLACLHALGFFTLEERLACRRLLALRYSR